jgi:hypothetical protein
VQQALSSLQARLRQSEAEMTALRGIYMHAYIYIYIIFYIYMYVYNIICTSAIL